MFVRLPLPEFWWLPAIFGAPRHVDLSLQSLSWRDYFPHVSFCFFFSSYKDTSGVGFRVHPIQCDLMLTQLHLQRPYFQIDDSHIYGGLENKTHTQKCLILRARKLFLEVYLSTSYISLLIIVSYAQV